MDKPVPCYDVYIPVAGQPDHLITKFRALTPEGAAELVRAILALHDKSIPEIRVSVGVAMLSEM